MDSIREQRIMELLERDPSIILMIKTKYLTDIMWKICIHQEPSLFQFMVNPSMDMVIYALNEDGANLQYLQMMEVPFTNDVIYTALSNYPGAIYHLPLEHRTSTVKEFACTKDPSLLRKLRVSDAFIQNRLRENPLDVKYLRYPTEEQLCNAIIQDHNAVVYVKEFTPRIINLIKELYPDMLDLLPKR